jgi:hypothetical protein
VPGDNPRDDLTQPLTIRQRELLPELREGHLLRALGWNRAAANRWGGALSGWNIGHLLADRRADVDTTVRVLTKPIH